MTTAYQKSILARQRVDELVGRKATFEKLAAHAKAAPGQGGLVLLSRPGADAGELLRSTYDKVFSEQSSIIPIYFAFDRRDGSVGRASLRFARDLIAQVVAFRLNDPVLVSSSPDISALRDQVTPDDSIWLDKIIEDYRSLCTESDPSVNAAGCFAMSDRIAKAGKRLFVMLDAMHETAYFADPREFVDSIKQQWSRAEFSFVISAHRRFLGKDFDLPRLMLDMPDEAATGAIVEGIAKRYDVEINDETRDLLVTQLQHDVSKIDAVIRRASANGISLDSFTNVEKVYADEIFGGGIGGYFDDVIASAAPSRSTAQILVTLLDGSILRSDPLVPIATWQKHFDLSERKFQRMLNVLNTAELIRVTSNRVEPMPENIAFADYIRGRSRLEVKGELRAAVIADATAAYTTRAFELMRRRYRDAAALDLREILMLFDRQNVPIGLLNYDVFKNKFKGLGETELVAMFANESSEYELPKIFFASHIESFYPQIRDHIDAERSAVGKGLQTATFGESDEVVWLAAEIDSKLEAEKDVAEFWSDRLEAAALMCDFTNYKIWLIAPEGFTAEALSVIEQRNGIGSSRPQVELLFEYLKGTVNAEDVDQALDEYSITIPMGGDGELIAANTLEEIARKHGLKSSVINQIKTAIVEACINASEHSLSPDGQIRLSFAVLDDRVNIKVANRGVRMAESSPAEGQESKARRGWGLKLMERLMDEVRLEQTDDGTLISMTKLLAA